MSKLTCYNCGGEGHFARQCPSCRCLGIQNSEIEEIEIAIEIRKMSNATDVKDTDILPRIVKNNPIKSLQGIMKEEKKEETEETGEKKEEEIVILEIEEKTILFVLTAANLAIQQEIVSQKESKNAITVERRVTQQEIVRTKKQQQREVSSAIIVMKSVTFQEIAQINNLDMYSYLEITYFNLSRIELKYLNLVGKLNSTYKLDNFILITNL